MPIIKLSFPVEEDRRWDGNAMNAREFDEFRMLNVGLTYQVDSLDIDYPNSLEMYMEKRIDSLQITKDDYHLEVFSRGYGLTYKLDIDKKYCSPFDCIDNEPIIIEGRLYEQKLLELGKIN